MSLFIFIFQFRLYYYVGTIQMEFGMLETFSGGDVIPKWVALS